MVLICLLLSLGCHILFCRLVDTPQGVQTAGITYEGNVLGNDFDEKRLVITYRLPPMRRVEPVMNAPRLLEHHQRGFAALDD